MPTISLICVISLSIIFLLLYTVYDLLTEYSRANSHYSRIQLIPCTDFIIDCVSSIVSFFRSAKFIIYALNQSGRVITDLRQCVLGSNHLYILLQFLINQYA